MGCVLQPGEIISAAALQPGQTTSDAVQPGQDIDDCFVAPLTIYTMSDVVETFQPSESGILGNCRLLWELQTNGNSFIITNPDDGSGPPDFTIINGGLDWISPKIDRLGPETYHFRASNFSGDARTGDSSAENVWLEIQANGAFLYGLEGNSQNNFSVSFLAEISLDGGSTVLADADVVLNLEIQP